jgi:hypothetical protein
MNILAKTSFSIGIGVLAGLVFCFVFLLFHHSSTQLLTRPASSQVQNQPPIISWVSVKDAQNAELTNEYEDYLFTQQNGKIYVSDRYDSPSYKVVFSNADPKTFLIGEEYGREFVGGSKPIMATSTIGYAKDNAHVYWFDIVGNDEPLKAKVEVLPGADPYTFDPRVGGYAYTMDKSHVYYDWFLVPGADPQTFTEIAGNLREYDAQDKNHKYLLGKIVQ